MPTEVAITAPIPDATFGQGQQHMPVGPDVGPHPYVSHPEQNPQDLRLVIEEDKASGAFVYKTIDRRTGDVIRQLPREQVLKLKERSDYAAGDVINARA